MTKKELPKPLFHISKVVCRRAETISGLKKTIEEIKTATDGTIWFTYTTNCYDCDKSKDECLKLGLYNGICPRGGLFDNSSKRYEEVKQELAKKGFNISWLDKVDRYIEEVRHFLEQQRKEKERYDGQV